MLAAGADDQGLLAPRPGGPEPLIDRIWHQFQTRGVDPEPVLGQFLLPA